VFAFCEHMAIYTNILCLPILITGLNLFEKVSGFTSEFLNPVNSALSPWIKGNELSHARTHTRTRTHAGAHDCIHRSLWTSAPELGVDLKVHHGVCG